MIINLQAETMEAILPLKNEVDMGWLGTQLSKDRSSKIDCTNTTGS